MKYSKKKIKGMLIILNKLYPKLKEKEANFIISESSDLPNFKGKFVVNKKTNKVRYVEIRERR